MSLLCRYIIFSHFIVLMLLTSDAFGRQACIGLFKDLKQNNNFLESIKLDFASSVEVEIPATDSVIELLTTIDGTLKPLVGPKLNRDDLKTMPPQLLQTLQDYVGLGADSHEKNEIVYLDSLLSVPWDVLTASEKRDFLMFAAPKDMFHFNVNRSIQGLKFREKIKLHFLQTSRFLGQDYRPGVYEFSSQDLFANTKIEYMGADRMRSNLGFEWHIRTHFNAGENYRTALSLQQALLNRVNNMHIHIVAPGLFVRNDPQHLQEKIINRPSFVNSIDPAEIETLQMMDLIRRLTMYFDMQMILHGKPMQTLYDSTGAQRFYPFEPSSLIDLALSFLSGAYDPEFPLRVHSKGGTVGIRSQHYYDQEVFGLEIRYLSPHLNPLTTAKVLSHIQHRLLDKNYFLTSLEVLKFLSVSKPADFVLREAVKDFFYTTRWYENISYKWKLSDHERRLFQDKIEKNDFLKMLAFDWSQSPWYFDKPNRIQQIEKVQKLAIAMLLASSSKDGIKYTRKELSQEQKILKDAEVLKYFVKKSGLQYDFQNMLMDF